MVCFLVNAGLTMLPNVSKSRVRWWIKLPEPLTGATVLISGSDMGAIAGADGEFVIKNVSKGKSNFSNTVFAGMIKNFQDAQYWTAGTVFNPAENSDAFTKAYFSTEALLNQTYTSIADLKLSGNPLDLTSPANMIPQADSPLATGAVWTNPLVSSGFEQVPYRGAFGPTETAANNWMTGWTEFDPQNAIY